MKEEHFIVTDKVPIPDIRHSRYRGVWSIFMNMKKGQSFTVSHARYKQAWSAIKWWSTRYGIKLYMARETDSETGVARYRIWRVD
ncbi:MAG: hypothetical protein ACREBU_01595 [Nitrososphaera sp.]